MKRTALTIAALTLFVTSAAAGSRDGNGPESPILRVAPGSSITFRVHGDAYERLDSLQVVHGQTRSDVSRYVTARIGEESRGGRWVTVSASSRSRIDSYYRIHGLERGRTRVQFPVRLVVDDRNPTTYARTPRTRPSYQLRELSVQMMPTTRHFTLSVKDHPEYKRDRTLDRYPADPMLGSDRSLWHPGGHTIDLGLAPYFRIDHVSPESPAFAGRELTIFGESLPYFEVRLGGVTLDPISNDSKQITVRLPESATIGDLTLYDPAKQAVSQPLVEDYQVLDRPIFDYFRENATGHDWLNAYLLGQISFLVYSDATGEEPYSEYEQRMKSSFGGWGLEVLKVIDVWKPAVTYKTSGSTQVVIARNRDAIFVVFAGTETWDEGEDMNNDLNAEWKSVDSWGKNMQVHNGVYEALQIVWSDITQTVQTYRGSRKLWITGHSLGGALAQLAAFRFRRFFPTSCPVQGVTTYAQLRVGNPQFATTMTAWFGSRSQRWAVAGDIVPAFPAYVGYQHTGELNNIHADGFIELDADGEMWMPTTIYISQVHNTYAQRIRDAITIHAPELLSLPLPAPLPN
ncbi:MAG: hypothetical protein RL885_08095 [Planctomycetota bacterium]